MKYTYKDYNCTRCAIAFHALTFSTAIAFYNMLNSTVTFTLEHTRYTVKVNQDFDSRFYSYEECEELIEKAFAKE